jgi:hypothetical protein
MTNFPAYGFGPKYELKAKHRFAIVRVANQLHILELYT